MSIILVYRAEGAGVCVRVPVLHRALSLSPSASSSDQSFTSSDEIKEWWKRTGRNVLPVSWYRLITFSGGTFLRGVQGNPNYFPILVQGDAVDGMSPI